MRSDLAFHEFIVSDVLKDVPNITSRAMFGGWGIYQNGIIFGLIGDGQLYFKTGKNNIEDYKQKNSHPFTYKNRGKTISMSYWLVPEDILEDPISLRFWVKKSVEVEKNN